MSKDGNQIYDLNPTEKEIAIWRAQRRLELRNQYLKEAHSPSPNYQGHILDPQLQRLYTTKFATENLFRPTVKNFLWFAFLTVGLMGPTMYFTKMYRDSREMKFRTGQVSYRDREWKFV